MKFKNALELFQHLLALDEEKMPQNLVTFIDENNAYYPEIISYIEAHQKNKDETVFKSLISEQAISLVDDDLIHSLIDKQVGYYKLIKKLGQGGMGAVYLGERNDGQLEQQVAIKFVYPSIIVLAGDDFLQKEAQHLANLEHTNIAKIHTVDTTDNGLPYMVMEYVEGIPIDQYCDDNKLDLKARLKLFKKVCDAVHIAHQNMVIHADIKPSNILVNKLGQPKLMDFGIARKVTERSKESEDCSDYQNQHIQAASSEFASPEQIKGEKLTTASDVYSLGKLMDKMGMVIKEISLIYVKCCSQLKEHRYHSVEQVIADINNWFGCYPLLADKPSITNKAFKGLQRNKGVVSFSLVFVLVILTFTKTLYDKKNELEKSYEQQLATTNFMTSIFNYSNKVEKEKVGEYTITELLDELSVKAVTELEEFPEARFVILFKMAKSYRSQKNYKKAKEIYEKMETLYDIEKGTKHLLLNYYASRAFVYRRLGESDLALKMYDKIEQLAAKMDGKTDAEKRSLSAASYSKSIFLYYQGEYEAAQATIYDALEKYSSVETPDSISSYYNTLGASYKKQGNHKRATKYLKKAIDIQSKIFNNNAHPSVLIKRFNLMSTYLMADDFKSAEYGLNDLLVDVKSAYGLDSELEFLIRNELANVYRLTARCEKGYQHIQYATKGLYTLDNKEKFALAMVDRAKLESCLNKNMLFSDSITQAIEAIELQFGRHSYKHLMVMYESYLAKKEFLLELDAVLLEEIYLQLLAKHPKNPKTKKVAEEYQRYKSQLIVNNST